MSVEFSTVTGTRTGDATTGSTSIGSVGRSGSASTSGTTGAVVAGLGRGLRRDVLGLRRDVGVDAEHAQGDDGHGHQALEDAVRLAGPVLLEDGDGGTLRSSALRRTASAACRSARMAARPPTGPVPGPRTAASRTSSSATVVGDGAERRRRDTDRSGMAVVPGASIAGVGRRSRGSVERRAQDARPERGRLRPVAVGGAGRAGGASSGAAPAAASRRCAGRTGRWRRARAPRRASVLRGPAPAGGLDRGAARGRGARAGRRGAAAGRGWAATAATTSSAGRSRRGSGAGTAWKGATEVSGAGGAGARPRARRAAAVARDAAGTGGSGSRERDSWRGARACGGRGRGRDADAAVVGPLATGRGRVIAQLGGRAAPEPVGDVRTATTGSHGGAAPVPSVTA